MVKLVRNHSRFWRLLALVLGFSTTCAAEFSLKLAPANCSPRRATLAWLPVLSQSCDSGPVSMTTVCWRFHLTFALIQSSAAIQISATFIAREAFEFTLLSASQTPWAASESIWSSFGLQAGRYRGRLFTRSSYSVSQCACGANPSTPR